MELERADFTAAVASRIVCPSGTMCMNFEAGETRSVPQRLFNVAIAAGLVPEGPLTIPEPAAKPVDSVKKVSDGLLDACKTLIARGNPQDFTIPGFPKAASVKKLVDFNFSAKDVERAFEQAMHEVEQDGDESKEPAESSLDIT